MIGPARHRSAVELRVLGTTDLRAGEAAGAESVLAQPKRLALLAYLAIAIPHGMHRRDRLLAMFWPESDQDHARAALRKGIHLLRRALGPAAVLTRGDDEVGLDPEAVWCDAVAFDRAVVAGRLALALELYRGDLLDGFYLRDSVEFERWLDEQRSRIRASAATAAWRLAEQMEGEAQPTAAASWGRRAMELTPFDERVLRKVLALLDRQGNRAGALAAYDHFRRRFAAEFGAAPSPETLRLVETIRSAPGA